MLGAHAAITANQQNNTSHTERIMIEWMSENLPAIASTLATAAIVIGFGGAILISHPGLFG
jgi:hypothetical protein